MYTINDDMRDLLVNLIFLQLMYVVEYVWCKTIRSRSSVLLHVIIVDETILYTAAKYNDFQMPILTEMYVSFCTKTFSLRF